MSDQPPPLNPVSQKIPGLAITSLVLGIISVMGAVLLIVPMVLAIIFGHISLARIRKDENLTGSGIAIAGLALGYASIFLGVIFAGMLAAMAIPAFQKVREASLQKMLSNDARQIAAGAQQILSEKGEQRIVFHIDPETGLVTGPLSEYVKQVSRGTHEVDGVIENDHDSFSLQNPRVYKGREVTFDLEGKMLSR